MHTSAGFFTEPVEDTLSVIWAGDTQIEAAHEKRTKTPTTFFVTVVNQLNTQIC
jgi:hypothetical protein